MKNFKTFSFLLGIIAFSLISTPSFAKQTWLSCMVKTNWEGETVKNSPPFTIKLDDTKEVFELPYANIQGKATFFQSTINFEYILNEYGKWFYSYEISRSNLNFSKTIKLIGGLVPARTDTGICKVIPAPSTKKNLI
jgi:hypothetical protein